MGICWERPGPWLPGTRRLWGAPLHNDEPAQILTAQLQIRLGEGKACSAPAPDYYRISCWNPEHMLCRKFGGESFKHHAAMQGMQGHQHQHLQMPQYCSTPLARLPLQQCIVSSLSGYKTSFCLQVCQPSAALSIYHFKQDLGG